MVYGVSQQPKKTRGSLFAERQENCLSSPSIGLTKRPPTNHKTKITDAGKVPTRTTHPIERSETDQFFATFAQSEARVFGVDGTEYEVHDIATGDFDYLNLRKRVQDSTGALGPLNDLTPAEAETFTGFSVSNGTLSATSIVGPLGFGLWQKLEGTSGLAAGLQKVNAGYFSEDSQSLSVYVKEPDVDAAPQVYLGFRDQSVGITYTATFEWSGGALTVFGSSTGIDASVDGPFEDGSYRATIKAATADLTLTNPGNVLWIEIGTYYSSPLDMLYWGAVFVPDSGDADADYLDAPEAFRAITVGDTTLVTNSRQPVAQSTDSADIAPTIPETFGTWEFSAGVLEDIEDVAYVQVVQAEYDAAYTINVQTENVAAEIYVETIESSAVSSTINIWELRITSEGVLGTWSVTVDAQVCSYTPTASTNTTQQICQGLANAIIQSSARAEAIVKMKKASGGGGQPHVPGYFYIVIEGTAGGVALSPSLVKPSGGGASLVETKVEGSNLLAEVTTDAGAQRFVKRFGGLGTVVTDYIHCGRIGSTVFFFAKEPILSLEVDDSAGEQLMTAAHKEVESFSDLPIKAHIGARIKVTQGAIEDDNVGYFVEYQQQDAITADAPDGLWVESVDYGVPQALDAATMPHQLTPRFYDAGGDQYDGTAFPDGSTGTPGDLYWEWAPIDWENRLVGDTTLSPWPSFLDTDLNPSQTITQIAFTRGRLGYVGGTAVHFSEASRYFSLFRTTNKTLVDSDPFQVLASHPKMTVVDQVLPFAERLVMFSERAQMLLTGEPFSARTVTLEPFLDFRTDSTLLPLVDGNRLKFLFPRALGDYLGVREVYPTTDGIFDAADRSLQIPAYLPPNPKSWTGDDRAETFVYLSGDDPTSLYVYKTVRAENQVLQTAWSKFTFTADDTIRGCHFMGKTLVMLVSRPDADYLETMDLTEFATDPNSSYVMLMDRRVSGLTLSPSFSSPNTTLSLPWDIPAGATVLVRELDGTEVTVVSTDTTTSGSHTVTVTGDYTATDTWVGLQYRAEYEFTEVQPKDRGERNETTAITGASVQLLKCRLAYEDSGHFTVVLQATDRSDIEVPFDAADPGTPEDGVHEVAVLAPTEQSTVIIRSDSPLPFTILNTEWDADLIARGTRIRN